MVHTRIPKTHGSERGPKPPPTWNVSKTYGPKDFLPSSLLILRKFYTLHPENCFSRFSWKWYDLIFHFHCFLNIYPAVHDFSKDFSIYHSTSYCSWFPLEFNRFQWSSFCFNLSPEIFSMLPDFFNVFHWVVEEDRIHEHSIDPCTTGTTAGNVRIQRSAKP